LLLGSPFSSDTSPSTESPNHRSTRWICSRKDASAPTTTIKAYRDRRYSDRNDQLQNKKFFFLLAWHLKLNQIRIFRVFSILWTFQIILVASVPKSLSTAMSNTNVLIIIIDSHTFWNMFRKHVPISIRINKNNWALLNFKFKITLKNNLFLIIIKRILSLWLTHGRSPAP